LVSKVENFGIIVRFNKNKMDFLKWKKTEGSENEETSPAVKIKIITALIIVGLATYLAYWIQTPEDIKADIVSSDETLQDEPEDNSVVSDTSLLAAADEPEEDVTSINGIVEVAIVDFAYSPDKVTISPGETVVWTNADTVSHTVTGSDFSSESLSAGDSYEYTFQEPGIYDYYCAFHPQMTGQVIVEEIMPAEDSETSESDFEGESVDIELPEESASPLANNEETMMESEFNENLPEVDSLKAAAQDSLLGDDQETLSAVTLDTPEFIEQMETQQTPEELATTGPEDALYLLFAVLALFVTRRHFMKIFN